MVLVYEQVQDDAAQAFDLLELPIEEFMRQEVPRLFTRHLEEEIDRLDGEEGRLLDGDYLRGPFIARLTSMISDSQDAAISAYQSRLRENDIQPSLMTPAPSSTTGPSQMQHYTAFGLDIVRPGIEAEETDT